MSPWGVICCGLSSAALYLLGRSCDRDAEALKSVTRVHRIKDLEKLLDIKSKVLPLVVAISGTVGSETPIICKDSGLRGVIVEAYHRLKKDEAGSIALTLDMSKEVPWYLDDGTRRVFVVGARAANGFFSNVRTVFEKSGRSLFGGTLDYFEDLKMLKADCSKSVFLTGTKLTIVGEAVKDDIGTLRIQRPHNGLFYFSPLTVDGLIADLGEKGRFCKDASIVLAAFGVCLIATHAIQFIRERMRRWEWRRRVRSAAAKRSGQKIQGSNGKAENGSDGTKRERPIPDLCVICLKQEYNAIFLPCGHVCCCMPCSSQLNNCPLCQRRIEQLGCGSFLVEVANPPFS